MFSGTSTCILCFFSCFGTTNATCHVFRCRYVVWSTSLRLPASTAFRRCAELSGSTRLVSLESTVVVVAVACPMYVCSSLLSFRQKHRKECKPSNFSLQLQVSHVGRAGQPMPLSSSLVSLSFAPSDTQHNKIACTCFVFRHWSYAARSSRLCCYPSRPRGKRKRSQSFSLGL